MSVSQSWLEIWPVLCSFVIFYLLPGWLVAAAIGLNRWWRVFAAPVFGACIPPLVALIVQPLGIFYSGWIVLAASVLLAGICLMVRVLATALSAGSSFGDKWRSRRALPVPEPRVWPVFAWMPLAVLVASVPYAMGMRLLTAPPQNWDSVYHMSAIRYILSSGQGSTLTLNHVLGINPDGLAYYPAGWHDFAVLLAWRDVPAAANFSTLVIPFLFAMGVAMLAQQLYPRSIWAVPAGILTGSSFMAFPSRIISYGVLWPTAWSYLWVFTYLVVLTRLWQIWMGRPTRGRLKYYLLAITAVAAAALAQPSAAFTIVYLTVGFVLVFTISYFRKYLPQLRLWEALLFWLATIMGTTVVLLGPRIKGLAWIYDFPNHIWSYGKTAPFAALLDVQLYNIGIGSHHISYFLALFTLIGMVVVLRNRYSWLLLAWLIFTGLFTLSVTMTPLHSLVGPWYSNPLRVGAMVPLLGAPLAAIGVTASWEWCAQKWLYRNTQTPVTNTGKTVVLGAIQPRATLVPLISTAADSTGGSATPGLPRNTRLNARVVVSFIVFALVLALFSRGFNAYLRMGQVREEWTWSSEPGWYSMISEQEIAGIESLPEKIGKNQAVIGSPMVGAAYVYSIAGLKTPFRALSAVTDPELSYLAREFDNLGKDQEICRILQKYGYKYVYYDSIVFSPEEANEWLHEEFHGLENPGSALKSLRPVAHFGAVTVYEVSPQVCKITKEPQDFTNKLK